MKIDLNCDMGEGIGHDKDILPYVTSANIACGFHAGDERGMAVDEERTKEERLKGYGF